MKQINLANFKASLPEVQAIIRSTLKVDAGPSSAYDIMAVCQGYKNYHVVKATAKQSYYEVRANLGTSEKPFYINKDLGHFDNKVLAQNAAYTLLDDCNIFMRWELLENGKSIDRFVDTTKKSEQGFLYQCTLQGDTVDDVINAIGEMKEHINSGLEDSYLGSTLHSFRYISAGNDHVPADNVDCIVSYKDYVLFDETGIIEAEDSRDEIYDIFCHREEEICLWRGDLIYARQITLDEAFDEDPGRVVHAISAIGNIQLHGNWESISQELQHQTQPFYLFLEINRER